MNNNFLNKSKYIGSRKGGKNGSQWFQTYTILHSKYSRNNSLIPETYRGTFWCVNCLNILVNLKVHEEKSYRIIALRFQVLRLFDEWQQNYHLRLLQIFLPEEDSENKLWHPWVLPCGATSVQSCPDGSPVSWHLYPALSLPHTAGWQQISDQTCCNRCACGKMYSKYSLLYLRH